MSQTTPAVSETIYDLKNRHVRHQSNDMWLIQGKSMTV